MPWYGWSLALFSPLDIGASTGSFRLLWVACVSLVLWLCYNAFTTLQSRHGIFGKSYFGLKGYHIGFTVFQPALSVTEQLSYRTSRASLPFALFVSATSRAVLLVVRSRVFLMLGTNLRPRDHR